MLNRRQAIPPPAPLLKVKPDVLKTPYAIALICTIAMAVVWNLPAMPQDLHYHRFADQRTLLEIPNFCNVLSNLPFLFVGIFGLYGLLRSKKIQLIDAQKPASIIFFFAVAWVAIGSGYYHLWPDNNTLLWDRLPMTVAFMALFSMVLSEFLSPRFSKVILALLIAFGVFSVLYWHLTELKGAGDLRLYILVQFLPMLLIPLLLIVCREKSPHLSGYWLLLFFYALAKLFEYFDQAIFDLLGVISGHSLKHMAAALGVLCLLLVYRGQTFSNRA